METKIKKRYSQHVERRIPGTNFVDQFKMLKAIPFYVVPVHGYWLIFVRRVAITPNIRMGGTGRDFYLIAVIKRKHGIS